MPAGSGHCPGGTLWKPRAHAPTQSTGVCGKDAMVLLTPKVREEGLVEKLQGRAQMLYQELMGCFSASVPTSAAPDPGCTCDFVPSTGHCWGQGWRAY